MKNFIFFNKLFQTNADKGILKFASKFSLYSLVLGSFALTISLSLLEGFDRSIHELAYKFDSRYQITTFNNSEFEFNDNIKSNVEDYDENAVFYPILEKYSLIRGSDGIKPILVKGVNNDYIKNKFNLNFKDNKSIIISESLKNEILNDNNDLAILNFPQENNYFNYNIDKFEVNNTFYTGFADYDNNIVFIPLESAQKLFYNNDKLITNLSIDTEKEYSREYLNKLEYVLGYPFMVRALEDLHQDKFVWIEVQKQPIPIVLGLITLVSSFVILSTLLILIVKKFKSIGILRAMGMSKKEIIKFFTAYGIKLGLKGSFIGCGVGIFLLIIQKYFKIVKIPSEIYFISELPVEILPLNIFIIILVSISLTLLATIIPAYISVKLDPINAIKAN